MYSVISLMIYYFLNPQVHLKKKPFKCQYCHQAFGRRDAMKRHQTHWCSMKRNVCKSETAVAAAAADTVIQ